MITTVTDVNYNLIGAGAEDLHQHVLICPSTLHGSPQFFSHEDVGRVQHGYDCFLKVSCEFILQDFRQLLSNVATDRKNKPETDSNRCTYGGSVYQ